MKNLIGLNILLVFIIIFLGKIISFLKNIFISFYFGATDISDAYFAANNISSILYLAFISSYLVLLIPEYDKFRKNKGQQEATDFLSKYLTFTTIVSIFLSLVCLLFIKPLIEFIAPHFDEKTKYIATSLGKILVLSFPFTAISLSLAATSTTYGKFYAQHIIPIFSGLLVIASLYFFVEQFGIYVLVLAGLSATLLQTMIQIYLSKSYFKYKFNFPIIDENIKNMTILVLPIFLGTLVEQLNLLANSIISSGLAKGSLSALNYAQTIQLTIIGTLTTAVLTVLYPKMSKLTSENRTADVIKTTWLGIKYLLLALTPIIIYFSINTTALIKAVYFRGSFNETALLQTSNILFYYLISIIFVSLREFIIRVYYLAGRTTFPMVIGAIAVFTNILLSYLFVAKLGAPGLSLANLVATFASVILLMLYLKVDLSYLYKDFKVFVMQLLSASFLVLVFHFSLGKYVTPNGIIDLFLYLIVDVTIFYGCLLFLKQSEVSHFYTSMKNKISIYVNK